MLNVSILMLSTLLTLAAVEFAARIHGTQALFAWKDYRGQALNIYKMRLPVQFDPSLGWIPKIGFSTADNRWGTQVTIVDHGVRSNGNGETKLRDGSPILAIGDSFTFGDEVSNTETWPSILERLLKKKVINAGVFAYGIDQAFIRLTMLLDIYRPDTIIFSFIPPDIARCEYSTAMGADKPYFKVSNNKLVLMNSPLKRPSEGSVPTLHEILGYSSFIHKLMMKLNPSWWLQGGRSWNENPTGANGEEITCLIFKELKTTANQKNIRNVYVVVQYGADLDPKLQVSVDSVKRCIEKEAVTVVDLKNRLLEIKNLNPERYGTLFLKKHMTYEGNYFVAENILKSMARSRAGLGGSRGGGG